jgi:hypothetical protein
MNYSKLLDKTLFNGYELIFSSVVMDRLKYALWEDIRKNTKDILSEHLDENLSQNILHRFKEKC